MSTNEIVSAVILGLITATTGFLWIIFLKRIKKKWNKVVYILKIILLNSIGFGYPLFKLLHLYFTEPFNKYFVLKFALYFSVLCIELLFVIAGVLFVVITNDLLKDDKKHIAEMQKLMDNIK